MTVTDKSNPENQAPETPQHETPQHVVTRTVPLDFGQEAGGQPKPPPKIRRWSPNNRGRLARLAGDLPADDGHAHNFGHSRTSNEARSLQFFAFLA